jgi:carbonic anhydrase
MPRVVQPEQLLKKLRRLQIARAQNLGASGAELMRAACIENVHQAMSDLFTLSPAVKAATANGTATVAGALYDIETGEVVGLNA